MVGLSLARRQMLGHLMMGSAALAAWPLAAQAAGMDPLPPSLDEVALRFPPLHPQFATALEVLVSVGDAIDAGAGPYGGRRIVPITGGRFRGRGLSGTVLPGGADRQTIRSDGIRELDATYELLADDGTVLKVHNRVIVDDQNPPPGERRYVRSVVTVEAPRGPHDWLNRRLLLGTLHSLRPAAPFVFLRFHVVE